MVSLEDLGFENKSFWPGYIISSFPTALDEDEDMSLSEVMEENEIDINMV